MNSAFKAMVQKRAKYQNKNTTVDGIEFDSKAEASRWCALRLLEKAGAISDLKRQVPFDLVPSVKLAGARAAKPAIKYVADFTYVERGALVVEDTKSAATAKLSDFRMKLHLMKHVHGIDVRLSK